MAKLIVKLHGQHFGELVLEDGQEYVIGRGADCAVVLSAQKGISRQHLKLFHSDGIWFAQSLSRFVPLQVDGKQQETIELNKNTTFLAPPFEFQFDLASEQASVVTPSISNPGAQKPQSHMYQAPPEPEEIRGNLELTVAGAVLLAPYLRILYTETEQQEVLRLEGETWIGGRESAAEITLRDSRVSRRHFELTRSREGFFITDLGSSNGTHLNGQRLPPHEPTRLESGDLIGVLDIEMIFEIRDLALANRLQQLPQSFPQNMMVVQSAGHYPALPPADALPAVMDEPSRALVDWRSWRSWNVQNVKQIEWRKVDYKKNKVRIALGVLIPVILIGLFTGGSDNSQRMPAGNPNDPLPFDRLTGEQKTAVKDAFSLARNLYVNGKYELCLAELAKLHEITKTGYENSRELAEFCQQGKELQSRNNDIERLEREKQALENQISMVVDGCKEKMKDATVEQVRICLKDAMDLNPEHPLVIGMLQAAQAHEEERKLMAVQKAKTAESAEKSRSAYHRAKSLQKNGELLKAKHAYENFIFGSYSDVDGLKETAKRDVAMVKMEMGKKISLYLDQCKTMGDKNQYKDAYLACDAALKQDPENQNAVAMRAQMLSNLRREIKSIYEDSVLEESLGNVDSAKDKWKKIITDDLDSDEYSKKSKVLLKKYGVEM